MEWIVFEQDLNSTYNISEEISRYIIDNFTINKINCTDFCIIKDRSGTGPGDIPDLT
jgi:hypothetical protein